MQRVETTYLIGLVKGNFLLPQKMFDDVDVNALADIQEWVIRNPFSMPVRNNFLVYLIKPQMQMPRRTLHAINHTIPIK